MAGDSLYARSTDQTFSVWRPSLRLVKFGAPKHGIAGLPSRLHPKKPGPSLDHRLNAETGSFDSLLGASRMPTCGRVRSTIQSNEVVPALPATSVALTASV